MKKIILIALAVMASASFSNIDAAKKKKNDKKEVAKQAVVLTTSSDSLSYASGIAVTNGLMAYVQKQLGVDTAYMA